MARARRRWLDWDRYADKCIKLCGDSHKASEGHWKAYNERARLHNRRIHRQVMAEVSQ